MKEIEEKVKELLNEKEWTFADLQDMNAVVKGMVEVLYDELSAKEKLDMIWESETTEVLSYNTLDDELIPMPFGVMFQGLVKDELTWEVMKVVKVELMNANVNFNTEVNENEISKRSVGGKSSKRLNASTKKNSEE
jgi:hypothetical protein